MDSPSPCGLQAVGIWQNDKPQHPHGIQSQRFSGEEGQSAIHVATSLSTGPDAGGPLLQLCGPDVCFLMRLYNHKAFQREFFTRQPDLDHYLQSFYSVDICCLGD